MNIYMNGGIIFCQLHLTFIYFLILLLIKRSLFDLTEPFVKLITKQKVILSLKLYRPIDCAIWGGGRQ